MEVINLKPFNFKKGWLSTKKILRKYNLVGILIVLFAICLYFTFYPFSNDDVFKIISSKSFDGGLILNKKCIYLNNTNNDKLLYNLNDFLNNSNYYQNSKIKKIFFLNVPKALGKDQATTNITLHKQLFIKMILPLIVNANLEVIEGYKRVVYLSNKMPKYQLTKEDVKLLKTLAHKYNVDSDFNSFWEELKVVNNLLVKVKPIPNSLVLAIAIKETGWGQSRFLHEGNSLFSEYTWQKDSGIIPLLRNVRDNYEIRNFNTLQEAVNSFFYNLNTGQNYAKFRIDRIKQTSKNPLKNIFQLVNDVAEYYSADDNYVASVKQIITVNNLMQYDKYDDFINSSPICLYFS